MKKIIASLFIFGITATSMAMEDEQQQQQPQEDNLAYLFPTSPYLPLELQAHIVEDGIQNIKETFLKNCIFRLESSSQVGARRNLFANTSIPSNPSGINTVINTTFHAQIDYTPPLYLHGIGNTLIINSSVSDLTQRMASMQTPDNINSLKTDLAFNTDKIPTRQVSITVNNNDNTKPNQFSYRINTDEIAAYNEMDAFFKTPFTLYQYSILNLIKRAVQKGKPVPLTERETKELIALFEEFPSLYSFVQKHVTLHASADNQMSNNNIMNNDNNNNNNNNHN